MDLGTQSIVATRTHPLLGANFLLLIRSWRISLGPTVPAAAAAEAAVCLSLGRVFDWTAAIWDAARSEDEWSILGVQPEG